MNNFITDITRWKSDGFLWSK